MIKNKLINLDNLINEGKQKSTELNKIWFRTYEAAKYLSISKTQLHIMKRDGVLPYSKLGGTLYFKKEDIDSILESNKVVGGIYEQDN